MKTFEQQMKEARLEIMRVVLGVFHTSAQFVAEGIIDGTPVDTGFLRNSFIVSLSPLPSLIKKGDDATEAISADVAKSNASLSIGKAKLTDTIHMGFTAVYAMRMEYGFDGTDSLGRQYNQSGRFFVRNQVQRWPEYVTKSIKMAGAQ